MGAFTFLSIGLFAFMLVASGCSSSQEDEELQQWMAAERNKTRPQIAPIAEPKRFKPQNYTQEAIVDPFSSEKLSQALRRDAGQASSHTALIAPELNRRKEPLEAYPLDAMVMVGSLDQRGTRIALIRVGGLIYQVRPGQYLGQNYGRITRISETEISLREIVQDAGGEWIERSGALQLQERSK